MRVSLGVADNDINSVRLGSDELERPKIVLDKLWFEQQVFWRIPRDRKLWEHNNFSTLR